MKAVSHEVRQRDGAVKQCPKHPDAGMTQGTIRSGEVHTWCNVCGHGVAWVLPNDSPALDEPDGPICDRATCVADGECGCPPADALDDHGTPAESQEHAPGAER